MDHHTLFTYRSLEELRKIQEDREVFTFKFVETKEMIDTCPEICIDISALIYHLQSNKNNIQAVYINFEGITEDTVIIAEEIIAESALELLPFLILDTDSYFSEESESSKQEILSHFKQYPRQKVYKYNNSADLDRIIQYSSEHTHRNLF